MTLPEVSRTRSLKSVSTDGSMPGLVSISSDTCDEAPLSVSEFLEMKTIFEPAVTGIGDDCDDDVDAVHVSEQHGNTATEHPGAVGMITTRGVGLSHSHMIRLMGIMDPVPAMVLGCGVDLREVCRYKHEVAAFGDTGNVSDSTLAVPELLLDLEFVGKAFLLRPLSGLCTSPVEIWRPARVRGR